MAETGKGATNNNVMDHRFPDTISGGEAIILAGGLGTRLRAAVPDVPKCMAPVAGKPFLAFVIDALRMQGIEHFVFALGYKAEVIQDYLTTFYPTLKYKIVIEKEPLGTGGAIHLALQACKQENVLVTNGDTLFKIDVKTLFQIHLSNQAHCTLALKPMQQFDRYGVVATRDNGEIISFQEKQYYQHGLINGGIYLLNKHAFLQLPFPQKFSFEKDYLEKYAGEGHFFGSVQEGYFIDIGIPEDYNKAQEDLQPRLLNLKAVDKSWTLFLDRDGVINDEIKGNYVLQWDQFHFSKGVMDAFKILSQKFGHFFIVTNQRGVGKALMTEADLRQIHNEMQKQVLEAGVALNGIYYCTSTENDCFDRKPNPGMALQAFKDHATVDASKCIMVGNKPSDMHFGRAAGMFTVFLTTTNPDEPFPHPDIDARFPSLLAFAQALQS